MHPTMISGFSVMLRIVSDESSPIAGSSRYCKQQFHVLVTVLNSKLHVNILKLLTHWYTKFNYDPLLKCSIIIVFNLLTFPTTLKQLVDTFFFIYLFAKWSIQQWIISFHYREKKTIIRIKLEIANRIWPHQDAWQLCDLCFLSGFGKVSSHTWSSLPA